MKFSKYLILWVFSSFITLFSFSSFAFERPISTTGTFVSSVLYSNESGCNSNQVTLGSYRTVCNSGFVSNSITINDGKSKVCYRSALPSNADTYCHYPFYGDTPANSTCNGSICTCNEGFHENFSQTACDINTPDVMGALIPAVIAAGAFIIGGIALIAGLPMIAAGAAAVGIHAAIFAAFGMPFDADVSTPQANVNNSGLPITVNLTPASTTPVKNDNSTPEVWKGAGGEFNPKGGASASWANSGATGTWEENSNGSTSLVKPNASGVKTKVAEISPDKTQMILFTSPNSAVSVKTYSDGSTNVSHAANLSVNDSNGQPTSLPVASVRSYNSSNQLVSTTALHSDANNNGTVANVTSTTNFGGLPSIGENEPSGGGGGDCDKEPQKCALLTNINLTLKGQGTNGEAVLTELDTKMDTKLSSYQSQANSMINDFVQGDLFANEFLSALNGTPNPLSYLQSKSGSCSLNLAFGDYGNQQLNLCPHMDTIHPVMAFAVFILMMFGLRDLFLEKETN